MPSIVQWGVDRLVAFHQRVRQEGRKLMGLYGMVEVQYPEAQEVNTQTFKTITPEWSYIHAGTSVVSFLLYIRFTPDFSIYR
jgi:hypothetical protein